MAGGGERSPAEGSRQSVAVSDPRVSRGLVKGRLSLHPSTCLSSRKPAGLCQGLFSGRLA